MEYGIMYLAILLVIAAMATTLWLFFRRLRKIEEERWGKDPGILSKFTARKTGRKKKAPAPRKAAPSDKPGG